MTAVYAAVDQRDTAANAFGVVQDKWSQWETLGSRKNCALSIALTLKRVSSFRPSSCRGFWFLNSFLLPGLASTDLCHAGGPSSVRRSRPFVIPGVGRRTLPSVVGTWPRDVVGNHGATDVPLAATTIAERHLKHPQSFDLVPLAMPTVSPVTDPGAIASLLWEQTGDFLPIDPSRAVRFRVNVHYPEWIDPTYAGLGPATKHAEDPRLDQNDLKRLSSFLRESRP